VRKLSTRKTQVIVLNRSVLTGLLVDFLFFLVLLFDGLPKFGISAVWVAISLYIEPVGDSVRLSADSNTQSSFDGSPLVSIFLYFEEPGFVASLFK
jgi:hypothetical protein